MTWILLIGVTLWFFRLEVVVALRDACLAAWRAIERKRARLEDREPMDFPPEP
jgi:hypothetical protein